MARRSEVDALTLQELRLAWTWTDWSTSVPQCQIRFLVSSSQVSGRGLHHQRWPATSVSKLAAVRVHTYK
eukprot:CAMPEP_0177552730 /NCGR_PEP_ID=MMETSP0369-20130122/67010_1 /TAXON_ID=447022 ORGANISM="Scrippsiella hangoei-like, Strain SHHI-4" /NCGR_SAMPLE_ID=MMETSP0369 /ASSEMBLY_ACC=CAM_ASM_000364 /LENGTH=69 /DNA_ID=CAMNT_0019038515 /DNA_START=42 /DNA_END=248 /DNA_ORIENTATION=-